MEQPKCWSSREIIQKLRIKNIEAVPETNTVLMLLNDVAKKEERKDGLYFRTSMGQISDSKLRKKSVAEVRVLEKYEKIRASPEEQKALLQRLHNRRKKRTSGRNILLENKWLCDDKTVCKEYWTKIYEYKEEIRNASTQSEKISLYSKWPVPPDENMSKEKVADKVKQRGRNLEMKVQQAISNHDQIQKERKDHLEFLSNKKRLLAFQKQEDLKNSRVYSFVQTLVIQSQSTNIFAEKLQAIRLFNIEKQQMLESVTTIQKLFKQSRAAENGLKFRNAIKNIRKFAIIAAATRKRERLANASEIIHWFFAVFCYENSNFQKIMRNYRYRVVNCQRFWRSFDLVTKARVKVISKKWDRHEKEKLKWERQKVFQEVKRSEAGLSDGRVSRSKQSGLKRLASSVGLNNQGNNAALKAALELGIPIHKRVPKDIKYLLIVDYLHSCRKDFKMTWIEFCRARRVMKAQSRLVSMEDARLAIHVDTNDELLEMFHKKSKHDDSAIRPPSMLLLTNTTVDVLNALIAKARRLVEEQLMDVLTVEGAANENTSTFLTTGVNFEI